MIKFIRKLLGKCEYDHFRTWGQDKDISKMECIFTFYPYENDLIGYSVSECTECGTRAFRCIGYHLLTSDITEVIDDFIAHKVIICDVIEVMNKWGYSYVYEPL